MERSLNLWLQAIFASIAWEFIQCARNVKPAFTAYTLLNRHLL